MKKRNVKKGISIFLIALTVLLIGAIAFIGIVFRGELSTITTVNKVSDGFYTMKCTYDYDFQSLLESGVSSDQELVDYIIDKLFRGVIHPKIDVSDFACTTFNARQEDGDIIFGRNFDYMDAACMLVWTEPKDGYASMSMTNLEFCGYDLEYLPDSFVNKFLTLAAPYAPVDGINEKGLCIGVLELETEPTSQNTERVDLTTTTMIRLVLDKAANVDEAIELFKSYDMHDSAGCCYHYQITDSTGKSVVLEYINNEIQLIYSQEKAGYKNSLVVANYYLSGNVDDPKGFGHERVETVTAGLKRNGGVVSSQEAMSLLSNAKMVNETDPNGYVCDTLWSAVYNCNDISLSLCAQMDYDTVYNFSLANPGKLN